MGTQPVDLVERDHDGRGGTLEGLGDPAVAGADPLVRVEHEQHGVAAGELGLHAALHAARQLVTRALNAGQVDEHELRLGARRHASDGAAGRLRLV